MNPLIEIDGVAYEVVRSLTSTRVIISYNGAFVFADKNLNRGVAGVWDLSDISASDSEKPILMALIKPTLDVTDVSITKD